MLCCSERIPCEGVSGGVVVVGGMRGETGGYQGSE